jgi:hypothetical protein
MSALSDYLENKLIDHIFRSGSFAAPTALHIALLTAAPSDSGGGTEVSGNNYARVALNPSDTNWKSTQNTATAGASTGTGGQTKNAVAITFPTPSGNWGTVSHFGIYDAASGGNLLFHGALTIAKTINQSDTVSFPADSLTITLA